MSWFEKAKTVLIEALDIQDDDSKAAEKDSPMAGAASDGGASPGNNATAETPGSAATPASDTPTFFDNPHANEMVTIPPTPTSVPGSAAYGKRQSATSDSVDLLSSPTSPISPCGGDVPSAAKRLSESSLELITATTASEVEMSPDTEPSLPDSIVIIASNDTSDNAEGDGEDDDDEGTQLKRHMEDHLNGIGPCRNSLFCIVC